MKCLFKIGLPFILIFQNCTKDSGKNPALAYSDRALFDSCAAPSHYYYKNDSLTVLSGAKGSNGQHGPFKLRFNNIAYTALSDSGKLSAGKLMPEGSLIIKDVYEGGKLNLYALMYKRSGSWLWAEIKANEQVQFSVFKNPGICVDCHSQQGNRDFLRTFTYY